MMSATASAQSMHGDALNRRSDVLAHLAFASQAIGSAEVDLGEGTLPVRLGMPDPVTGSFALELDLSPLQGPAPGATVRVRYARADDCYGFLTSVLRLEGPQRWVLRPPAVVERIQRRRTPRVALQAGDGFDLCVVAPGYGARVVLLRDLSVAGLSFEVPDNWAALFVGQRLAGTVGLPGGERLPVVIRLRNIRGSNSGGAPVVGASIEELVAEHRVTLRRALNSLSS
jgi:hypothetical protein